MVIVSATLNVLQAASKAQSRDQNYAQEITNTQAALARLMHDLRQATGFQLITPTAIQFTTVSGSTTYNVKYDCSAPDTLGSPYTRCARTSAVAPAAPPAYGSKAGSLDIQHVLNGTSSTFCNAGGTAQAGVFLVSDSTTPNTDGSNLACDETYAYNIAALTVHPNYVQVMVKVPASNDLKTGGMTHQTVLTSGAFIPNLELGG